VNPVVRSLTASASPNFQVKGVGDFNGDSKADILYKDLLTGQSALWLVNDKAIAFKSFIDFYNSALI